MIVALLGDLEGDRDWAVDRLRVIGERGDVRMVLQLGDLRFGMGPDPDGYLDAIDSACADHGLEMWSIGGNHEHWARLDELWSLPEWQLPDGSLAPLRLRERVLMLPRGHRWELGARSFVALGGAPSVNVTQLTEGVDWWPSEVVEERHVDATVAGGSADVMLTHDSPGPPYCTAPVGEIITGNPWGRPDSTLAYAQTGIDRITRAVTGVAPRLLVHGHFHVGGEAVVHLPGACRPTMVWSLGANGDEANLRYLDMETLVDP
ncbi:hypothetical protein [Nocardioides flavescens]|uniref:Calcineurin-like phosphoesterase domain-containing protein n=1 Tax=Nocardioides flavescens TaxID=2691959 RepID=A0A6L7EW55_9ACTN|nr:hypothetical protein [Nocardioides flavescens]MXG91633.1 hypothetical protein [Nocardioides flavescens]